MNKKNKNKGFSLIELIIAIAILVILTGLLAPQFMKYIEKSREAKDVQAMDTVYTSVQAALANEKSYDEVVKLVNDAGGNIYTTTVKELIEDGSSFGTELKSLVGDTTRLALKSKKATSSDGKTQGVICLAIEYKPGKENVGGDGKPGNDPEKWVETFGGFEVMVYCGDDGKKLIEGLQTIGTTITLK